MNIKKVDDKPMVIHTKEKPKVHVKGAPETKIKGRNILTVQHGPKIAGSVAEKSVAADGKIKLKRSFVHVTDKRKTVQAKTAADGMEYRGRNGGGTVQDRKGNGTTQGRNGATVQGRYADRNTQGRQGKEQEVRQSVNKENRMYAQYRIAKAEKEAAIKKKSALPSGIASVAARTALDEMEGGNEVHDAYMTAYTLAKPVTNAVDAGRNLYRSQAAKAKQDKLKKKQAKSRIKEKAVKESAVKTARKTAQTAAKETAKETGKKVAKETSKAAAKTAAATAGTGAGGVLAGIAAGEAVGIAMDKRELKNSTRNRMIKLFVAKLRQEDNQDSIGKALKDIVLMRFSLMAKYIVRYVGLFLLALFAVVALIALPVIAIIAVIYNSPFAIFFPSISLGETTQEVLSAYVSEFNADVNAELRNHAGYDESEKIYVNFEGSGTPDNFCDILMVYMVKYGDGDTATDMTDKAKQNLKAVFDDMCSYTINIGNRKKLINGNGFVFGVPGSGKSFFCKMEMGNVFLSGNDEIIAIDPMNEYFDIAQTYGGTVVNMSTYTDNYVNPLDMDVWSLDLNDSKGMIREKGEFMLGLCEQCMGENLNSRQKSIIDRCVRKLYIEIARSREKYVPIMSDFYEILMNQPEDEARDIALSLELFVNGSLNIFNHQTNVDVDNRFTVYGIRDLGTELSPITMLVMMESIQNRIIANGKRGIATWLYIEEFHVLLNSEYSAKYLQQLWKKV